MKNLKQIKAKFKKKAFTLVELLVAIAIVAVISTVSVVGYTSFIKKADISNDETLVRQLNSFLDAYRVSNGNLEVTPENAREVILAVMEKGKVAELVPNSAKYGYHFYLDFSEGKAKFALKHNDDAFGADSQNAVPEMCFTKNSLFFADTQGNDLADFVNKFYTVSSQAELNSFKNEAVSNIELDDGIRSGVFTEFIDKGLFVSNEGSFSINFSGNTMVFFNYGITAISNNGDFSSLDITSPIKIPARVTFAATDSLNSSYPYDENDANTHAPVFKLDYSNEAEVAEAFDRDFTNAVFELNNGKRYISKNGQIIPLGGEGTPDYSASVSVSVKNPMTDFDVTLSENTDQVDVRGEYVYVAYDIGSFTLAPTGFVSANGNDNAISSKEVTWSLENAESLSDIITVESTTGVVTLKKMLSFGETCEFPAVAKAVVGDAEVNFTIRVVCFKDAPITLGEVGLSGKDTITLLYDKEGVYAQNKFSATAGEVKYNFEEHNVTLKSDLKLETVAPVQNDGKSDIFKLSTDGKTLLLKSDNLDGKQTIKVKLGNYLAKTVDVTLFNVDSLTFIKTFDNIRYVGDDNAIKVGDLFSIPDGKTLPEGAKLMVYKNLSGTDYTNMEDRFLATTVEASSVSLTGDWANQTIKFKDIGSSNLMGEKVVIAIICDGYRISDNFEVTPVNGYNVTKVDHEDINWKSGNQSLVLLNNIEMWQGGNKMNADNYIVIGENQTLWGNCFKLNIKNGYYSDNAVGAGIVNLFGTIRDTMIVGDTYTEFGTSVADTYGASAVVTKYNQAKNNIPQLINSYISGCRSPLRMDSSITVTDCVFFGGTYSNIDISGGFTLTLNGTNYTVNYGYGNSVGTGITCWFNDYNRTVINNGTLKQYNFISSDDTGKMASINFEALGKKISVSDLGNIFNEILVKEKDTYGEFIFSKDGKDYVNSGIVCLDYEATGVVNVIDNAEKKLQYKGATKKLTICSETLWNPILSFLPSVSSALKPKGISNYEINNYVYSPIAEENQPLFEEALLAEANKTFEPEIFKLTWGN